MEIEVREVKITGRSDDGSRVRSKSGNGVRGAVETRGEHDEINLRGITCDTFQSVGKVMYSERPIRVRCIIARTSEFRDFVTEVEEESHRLRLLFRAETVIEFQFRIEARRPLIAPIRFFGEEPSVPVIIEFSVTERKKEQEVPPGSFVKDKHLGLRISHRDHCCSNESLLVCSVRIAAGVVIEVVTVAVDDEYH
jgi:hypothetical protein